jgi:hypothetical protein
MVLLCLGMLLDSRKTYTISGETVLSRLNLLKKRPYYFIFYTTWPTINDRYESNLLKDGSLFPPCMNDRPFTYRVICFKEQGEYHL